MVGKGRDAGGQQAKPVREPFAATAVPPTHVLLNPVAWLLWLLDFFLWLFSIVGPMRWMLGLLAPPAAVCITEEKDTIWRSAEAKKELVVSAFPECKTTHDFIQRAVALYSDRPALGTRIFLGDHWKESSKFPLKKFGATNWVNYRDFGTMAANFGAGLLKLGLKPLSIGTDLEKSGGPHTILIFEETCAHWITALFGAFSQSIVVATSYATLGTSAVIEAINETEARAVVCNIKEVEKLAAACAESCLKLSSIIYTTNLSEKKSIETPKDCAIRAWSVEDVIELGSQAGSLRYTPPSAEQLAVIMYTSGSTGRPKGVMVKHSCLAASVGAYYNKFVQQFGFQEGRGRMLAYLPAAHILELVSEIVAFSGGAAVGFADPRTLSSKGACRERPDGGINYKPGYPYPPGAIQEFRPMQLGAVPKIWDILKKGVEDVLAKGPAPARFLFQVAYSGRYLAVKQGRESPLFRYLVFRKLTQMMGGSLRLGCSGGGPISAEVQGFIRTAFCMHLIQGYALTETTCAGALQTLDDVRFGVVGPPLGSVEVKVRSCLNAQNEAEILDSTGRAYLATDRSHHDGTPCMGRGEVMIRGNSVSCGYFKQPDKTAEAFESSGWFRTGDVGIILNDGAIRIVDRVKNLVKLKGGEYVAIESMEKEYSNSIYVNAINGGVMCYGDGEMDRPVALVQINFQELEQWAVQNRVAFGSPDALCSNESSVAQVLDSLQVQGKKANLCRNEILCAIALISGTGPMEGDVTCASPWTPENGCLTASNKLNRKPIQEKYAAIFDPLRQLGIQ